MMANSLLTTSRVKTNQNIQVYLRVRPMNEREKSMRSQEAVEVASNREVIVKQDYRSVKKFTFDRSFGPESNQAAVYQSVVAPYIEEVLAGYNCTVFAYGQTGTGKTHSMIGEECANVGISWDDNSDVGMIPRAVNHLFEELRILGVEFSMRISFLELYNEELSDLLSVSDTSPSPIRIYDDNSKKGSIIVHGLEELPVHNSSDVYKLLAKGQEKRKTAATLMNVQSSRSHTIFSILVHIREYNADGEEVLKVGKLNLVDLAGSENISKAGNEKGIRTRETVNINQSLLTLGRVITALVERTPHIPYRESKLTRLLQESLGGRTKTSIIATVSPGHKDLEETLSTLEYAHRAKNIQNKPEVNQKLTKKLALKEYTEEIDKLKRDLQASRMKNGIYLAEETYAEMTDRLDVQNQELSEKHSTIKVLKDEMAKIQKVFNEVSLNLVEKETELAETYETLHFTKAELGQTVNLLRNTKKRYHEKKQVLASHIQTETVLTSQAQELKRAADSASTDTYLLHDTIERRKLTDRNIVSVCDSFQQAMHSNINDMTSNFDDFAKHVDIESKNGVEHIETSSARNAHFTSVVLEKLSKQRQTCEIDTDTVKKLLSEKLTQEMCFTAKQMDLIESVINQSIAEERKFNDSVFNEMLTSLLSLINEQSYQLLEKEALILEMVNAQRTATSTFCSVQTTKLEKLSSDITELLQNCRSTVDNSMAKNNRIAEDMTKLLDEWKSNTEEMVTISPTISQSIEMVQNAARDQIEQIESVNVGNEKRSSELNKELIGVSSDIKRSTETSHSQIATIMKSVNDRSKLVAASLKSSSILIGQQFDQAKMVATQAIGDINSKIVNAMQNVQSTVTDITNDVKCENDEFQEDSGKHLNFNINLSSTVQRFNDSSMKMLMDWRASLDNFRRNQIKTYSSSGATPAKREFNYPKTLAATSPHDRIIRRFWSEHNDSDLNVSTTISEGNETAFMNGLHGIQSSSMVQDQIADRGIDVIQSSSMVPEELIADRVLNEIRLPDSSPLAISNGNLNGPLSSFNIVSSPLVISNGHLIAPMPSLNVDNVEISPIRADSYLNQEPNESNQEHF